MSRLIDIAGERFSRLVAVEVIRRVRYRGSVKVYWSCKCDCGNEVQASGNELRRHHTRSCGCLRAERAAPRFRTHGLAGTELHGLWKNIKNRCFNQTLRQWNDYGGRGITVCDRWCDNFEAFHDDIMATIGPKPPGLSLDRIDNDGNYEPGNVRWATGSEQRMNQRRMKDDGRTARPADQTQGP